MCCNQSRHKPFVIAMVVTKNGRVISIGHNSFIRTSPIQKYWATKVNKPYKEYIHAEIMALHRIPYTARSKAYAIYVYRFDRNHRPANAKPCTVCSAAIRHFNINHVYYTTADDDLGMTYERYDRYRTIYADRWCDRDDRD